MQSPLLSVALPFLGQPKIRVRRVPGADRPLVVLQDVFTKLGGVSASHAARSIKTARDSIGREVAVRSLVEGGNTLLLTTLGLAVDLLVEIKTPAAQQIRRQLIELGKLVLSGDREGTVAEEIQANKEWLDAMPQAQQDLFQELLQPEGRSDQGSMVVTEEDRRVQPVDNNLKLEEIKLQREQLVLRQAEMRQAELEADRPAKMLKVAEGFMGALKSIDMCGPAEQLVIKDVLMNGLGMMGGNSSLSRQLALPAAQPADTQASTLLTISEYLNLHCGKTLKTHEASKIGKEVAQMYRLEVGEEFASGVDIPQKLQSVNGRVDHVNVYGTKPVRPGKRSGQQIIHDVLLNKKLIR